MTRCTDGSDVIMIQTLLVSDQPALDQKPYSPCAPLCLLPPNISVAERRRGTPLWPANEDIHSECTLFCEGDIHHFMEQSRRNRIERLRATEQVSNSDFVVICSPSGRACRTQDFAQKLKHRFWFYSSHAVTEITNDCNCDR